VGDTKYGSKHKASYIALHHTKILFDHPISKEQIVLSSPCDFEKFSF